MLGWFYWLRYQALPEGEDQDDFDLAISMLTPCFAAGLTPLPRPTLFYLVAAIGDHATALLRRALASQDHSITEEAVNLWRLIGKAVPDHPERAAILYNAGLALQASFRQSGNAEDLDEAIEMWRTSATATSAADRITYLLALKGTA